MPRSLDGLLWLLILLLPLVLVQRWLHREIQILLLLLTRRNDLVPVFFSILFLPGVVIHEFSHYFVAVLLQVRTGKFSIVPRPTPDGRLQLGYVETAKTDILRDAIIGSAPILSGGAIVAYAGLVRLNLGSIWNAIFDGGNLFLSLEQVYQSPDFWLWFYIILAVSSTMLPSRSDRRAWLPLAVFIVILLILGLIAGLGPWLLLKIAPPLNKGFQAFAVVLGISTLVHLVLVAPVWLIRRGLMRFLKIKSIEGTGH